MAYEAIFGELIRPSIAAEFFLKSLIVCVLLAAVLVLFIFVLPTKNAVKDTLRKNKKMFVVNYIALAAMSFPIYGCHAYRLEPCWPDSNGEYKASYHIQGEEWSVIAIFFYLAIMAVLIICTAVSFWKGQKRSAVGWKSQKRNALGCVGKSILLQMTTIIFPFIFAVFWGLFLNAVFALFFNAWFMTGVWFIQNVLDEDAAVPPQFFLRVIMPPLTFAFMAIVEVLIVNVVGGVVYKTTTLIKARKSNNKGTKNDGKAPRTGVNGMEKKIKRIMIKDFDLTAFWQRIKGGIRRNRFIMIFISAAITIAFLLFDLLEKERVKGMIVGSSSGVCDGDVAGGPDPEVDLALLASAFNIFLLIGGIIAAFHVFEYLFNKEKAEMTFALPLSRRQCFFADYLAGLISYTIPFGVLTVAFNISCHYIAHYYPSNGRFAKDLFAEDLFTEGKISVLFFVLHLFVYSWAVFAVSISGKKKKATSVMTGVLLFSHIIMALVTSGFNKIGLISGDTSGNILAATSPAGLFVVLFYSLIDGEVELYQALVGAVIISVVLSAASYLLYNRRKHEEIGEKYRVKAISFTISLAVLFASFMLAHTAMTVDRTTIAVATLVVGFIISKSIWIRKDDEDKKDAMVKYAVLVGVAILLTIIAVFLIKQKAME